MEIIKEYSEFNLDRVIKTLFNDTPKYVFEEFFNAKGGMFRRYISELLDKNYTIDDIEDYLHGSDNYSKWRKVKIVTWVAEF